MNILSLNQFGSTLTGREFGQTSYKSLMNEPFPVALDFSGVASLGSSFADEVIPPLALRQENKIIVMNVNDVVRSCLRDVRDETGIKMVIGITEGGSIRETGSI